MAVENILVLETTLDDTQPQIIGYVLEQALAMGALDAYAQPVQMKKSRPGVLVTLLARPEERAALVGLLMRETSTLGVRVSRCERDVLERATTVVSTAYGPIRVKVARLDTLKPASGGNKAMPEYEDCRAAAQRHGVALREVMAAALAGLPE